MSGWSAGREVERYQPSQLGAAVLASALAPDEGLAVFAELQKARRCFVLENELHLVYLVRTRRHTQSGWTTWTLLCPCLRFELQFYYV